MLSLGLRGLSSPHIHLDRSHCTTSHDHELTKSTQSSTMYKGKRSQPQDDPTREPKRRSMSNTALVDSTTPAVPTIATSSGQGKTISQLDSTEAVWAVPHLLHPFQVKADSTRLFHQRLSLLSLPFTRDNHPRISLTSSRILRLPLDLLLLFTSIANSPRSPNYRRSQTFSLRTRTLPVHLPSYSRNSSFKLRLLGRHQTLRHSSTSRLATPVPLVLRLAVHGRRRKTSPLFPSQQQSSEELTSTCGSSSLLRRLSTTNRQQALARSNWSGGSQREGEKSDWWDESGG